MDTCKDIVTGKYYEFLGFSQRSIVGHTYIDSLTHATVRDRTTDQYIYLPINRLEFIEGGLGNDRES